MLSRRDISTFIGASGLSLLAPNLAGAEVKEVQGEWTGTLQAGSAKLRLKLVIEGEKVTLYSLDQGNSAIPGHDLKIEGDHIKVGFKVIGATYNGTLKGDTIFGTFTQGGHPLPLDFGRGEGAVMQTPTPALSQSRLEALRLKVGIPALGAGFQKGSTSQFWVSGVRAKGKSVAVTVDDQWHWGSITKSMTATLVARMVEAGIVTWEDTVGACLGASVNGAQGQYLTVNFLHLLSHHAGLQANIDLKDMIRFGRDGAKDIVADRLKYAQLALQQTPTSPAGSAFLYSNNGFIIAGAMLEAKTKTSWETLIRDYVFTPLGLSSAGFGAPGSKDRLDHPMGHAEGILGFSAHYPPNDLTDNVEALGPAGRVHMNMKDMLTYLAAHRDQPAHFLQKTSWERLHTAPFGHNYALGWAIRPDGSLWHNGSNTLWYGEILVDKASGIVATAIANDPRAAAQIAVGEALLGAKAAALEPHA